MHGCLYTYLRECITHCAHKHFLSQSFEYIYTCVNIYVSRHNSSHPLYLHTLHHKNIVFFISLFFQKKKTTAGVLKKIKDWK
jgi:hypothetical protein